MTRRPVSLPPLTCLLLAAAACGEEPEPRPAPAPRAVAGQAYFFDMQEPGTIEWVSGPGAEAFLWERPGERQVLGEDGLFRFEGVPEGSRATVALEHPGFFPILTATHVLGGEDIEDLTLQVVSTRIADLVGLLVGEDPYDPSRCQMSLTVMRASEERWDIWAPGEPDAVAVVQPEVRRGTGVIYFNAQTIPDGTLTPTTTDGGIMAAGADPGTYVWTAHKPGYTFDSVELRCVAGWMANASPPWGVQAFAAEEG